jgi:hypothetical protein
MMMDCASAACDLKLCVGVNENRKHVNLHMLCVFVSTCVHVFVCVSVPMCSISVGGAATHEWVLGRVIACRWAGALAIV